MRKIDGQTFYTMMISAANSLENNKTIINNMNIFPVPDGDTGINMSLTMCAIRELSRFDGSISDCADKASNFILRAARGNSGAILSLFFRGVSKSLRGLNEADLRLKGGLSMGHKKGPDRQQGRGYKAA